QGVERGIEGYITFFVVSSSGSAVAEEHVRPGASASISVLPGKEYELVSYIRDCHENCEHGLGPPVDECRAPFVLKAGETLYARRLAESDSRASQHCMVTITGFPLVEGKNNK